MKEIKAWQCGFCPKCFALKANAKRHEARCYMNPTMKSCKTCMWGCRDLVGEYWTQSYDGPEQHDSYGPCCSFHNKGMADDPWGIDTIGGDEHLRGNCRHYKYKGYAGWGEPVYPEDEKEA